MALKGVKKGKLSKIKIPTSANSWLTNAGKSIGIASWDILKDIMPAATDIGETAVSYADDLKQQLQQIKSSQGKLSDAMNRSVLGDYIDMVNTARKNTLSDLKSGKLYTSASEQVGDFDLGDFDLGDDFDVDDDFDTSFESEDGVTHVATSRKSGKGVDIQNVNVTVDVGKNSPLTEAIDRQTKVAIDAQQSTAEFNSKFSANLFNRLNTSSTKQIGLLDSINQNVSTITVNLTETVSKQAALSAKYYEDSIALFKSINDTVIAIKDSVAGTGNGINAKGNYTSDRYQNVNDMFNSNGVLDLGAYKGLAKKQLSNAMANNMVISSIMSVLSDKDSLKDMMAHPLSYVTQGALKSLINKQLKVSAQNFDRTLSEFSIAALSRLRGFKDNDKGGILGPLLSFLGESFGVSNTFKSGVDKSKYNRGKVDWNGESHKTLNEVIPYYLRKIAASLSGQQEMVYDYNRGTFTTLEKARKEYNDDLNRDLLSDFQEEISNFSNLMKSTITTSDKATQDAISKGFNDFIAKLVKTEGIRVYRDRKEGSFNKSIAELMGWGQNDVLTQLISGYVDSMNNGDVMGMFGRKVNDARYRYTQNRIAEEEGRLASNAKYVGDGTGDADQHLRKSNGKTSSFIDYTKSGLIESDKYGKTPTYYLRGIYSLLAHGIRVYPVGGLNPNGTITGTDSVVGFSDKILADLGEQKDELSVFNTKASREYQGPTKSAEMIANDVNKGKIHIGSIYDTDGSGLRKSVMDYADQQRKAERDKELNKENWFTKLTKLPPQSPLARFVTTMETITTKPVQAVSKLFKSADSALFKIVFGDVDGDDNTSLLRAGINAVKTQFQKFAAFVNNEILEPLKEKIFGENGLIEKFKQSSFYQSISEKIKGSKLYGKFQELKETGKGKAASLFGAIKDRIKVRTNDFLDNIFGPSGEGGKREIVDTLISDLKMNKSEIGIGAGIGVLGSLFLPGGPILGAFLGAGTAFARRSKTFNNFLFGDENAEGGLFTKEFQGFLKNNSTGIKVGAGVGLAASLGFLPSLFIPGGPIGGAIIGAGISFATKSEAMQNILFGPDDGNGNRSGGLLGKFKGAFSKLAGGRDGKAMWLDAGIGAGIGLLGGLFLPTGPILGAALGAGAGIGLFSEQFKTLLLGDKEKGTKGLFGIIKSAFLPLKEGFANLQHSLMGFLERSIAIPITIAFQPLMDTVRGVAEKVKNGIVGIARFTGGLLKRAIIGEKGADGKRKGGIFAPLINIATAAGKAVTKWTGKIVSFPFKVLEAAAYALDLKHKIKWLVEPIMKPIRAVAGVVGNALKTAVSTAMKTIWKVATAPIWIPFKMLKGMGKFLAGAGRKAMDFVGNAFGFRRNKVDEEGNRKETFGERFRRRMTEQAMENSDGRYHGMISGLTLKDYGKRSRQESLDWEEYNKLFNSKSSKDKLEKRLKYFQQRKVVGYDENGNKQTKTFAEVLGLNSVDDILNGNVTRLSRGDMAKKLGNLNWTGATNVDGASSRIAQVKEMKIEEATVDKVDMDAKTVNIKADNVKGLGKNEGFSIFDDGEENAIGNAVKFAKNMADNVEGMAGGGIVRKTGLFLLSKGEKVKSAIGKVGKNLLGEGKVRSLLSKGNLKDSLGESDSNYNEQKNSSVNVSAQQQKDELEERQDAKRYKHDEVMAAKKEAEKEAKEQTFRETLIGLTHNAAENAKQHFSNWGGIFGKKGLITLALLAALPFLKSIITNAFPTVVNVLSGIGSIIGSIINRVSERFNWNDTKQELGTQYDETKTMLGFDTKKHYMVDPETGTIMLDENGKPMTYRDAKKKGFFGRMFDWIFPEKTKIDPETGKAYTIEHDYDASTQMRGKATFQAVRFAEKQSAKIAKNVGVPVAQGMDAAKAFVNMPKGSGLANRMGAAKTSLKNSKSILKASKEVAGEAVEYGITKAAMNNNTAKLVAGGVSEGKKGMIAMFVSKLKQISIWLSDEFIKVAKKFCKDGSKISKIAGIVKGLFDKLTESKLGQLGQKLIGWITKASTKLATAAETLLLSDLAMGIVGGLAGACNAENIFQMDFDTLAIPTQLLLRSLCAVYRGLASTSMGTWADIANSCFYLLFDVDLFAELIIKIAQLLLGIFGESGKAEAEKITIARQDFYKEYQDYVEQEYDAYVENAKANGQSYIGQGLDREAALNEWRGSGVATTFEDYNMEQHKTLGKRIWDGTKSAAKSVGSGIKKVGTSIKESRFGKFVGNRVNQIKSGISSVATGIGNVAKKGFDIGKSVGSDFIKNVLPWALSIKEEIPPINTNGGTEDPTNINLIRIMRAITTHIGMPIRTVSHGVKTVASTIIDKVSKGMQTFKDIKQDGLDKVTGLGSIFNGDYFSFDEGDTGDDLSGIKKVAAFNARLMGIGGAIAKGLGLDISKLYEKFLSGKETMDSIKQDGLDKVTGIASIFNGDYFSFDEDDTGYGLSGIKKAVAFNVRLMGIGGAAVKGLGLDAVKIYEGIKTEFSNIGKTISQASDITSAAPWDTSYWKAPNLTTVTGIGGAIGTALYYVNKLIHAIPAAIYSVTSDIKDWVDKHENNPIVKILKSLFGFGNKNTSDEKKESLLANIVNSIGGFLADLGPNASQKANGLSNIYNTDGGNGETPKMVNGFPYYSQNDQSIKNKPYKLSGNGQSVIPETMGARGCGPTAMAMVASKLKGGYGNPYNPQNMASLATGENYSTNAGTSIGYFTGVGTQLGMNVTPGAGTAENINYLLSSGQPVILQGQSNKAGSPYTGGGHYVVGVGYDRNGNVLVNDPRGAQYSKPYSMDKLTDGAGMVFGFSNGGYGPSTVPQIQTSMSSYAASSTPSINIQTNASSYAAASSSNVPQIQTSITSSNQDAVNRTLANMRNKAQNQSAQDARVAALEKKYSAANMGKIKAQDSKNYESSIARARKAVCGAMISRYKKNQYSQSNRGRFWTGSADCSSSCQAAYKAAVGIDPGCTTADMMSKANTVGRIVDSNKHAEPDWSKLNPGDLMLFSKTDDYNTVGHVEMYLGPTYTAPDGETFTKAFIGHGSGVGPRAKSWSEYWRKRYLCTVTYITTDTQVLDPSFINYANGVVPGSGMSVGADGMPVDGTSSVAAASSKPRTLSGVLSAFADAMASPVKDFLFGKEETPVDTSSSTSGDSFGVTNNTSSISAADINPSDVASSVWKFFTKRGYSKEATAGIMGNLQAESGMNPASVQKGSGHAAGIAQWESYKNRSARWKAMSDFASSRGRNWTDLESQLMFIDKELMGLNGYFDNDKTIEGYHGAPTSFANWAVSKDVADATIQFEKAFERAGKPHMANRISYAKGFYNQYANQTQSTAAKKQTATDDYWANYAKAHGMGGYGEIDTSLLERDAKRASSFRGANRDGYSNPRYVGGFGNSTELNRKLDRATAISVESDKSNTEAIALMTQMLAEMKGTNQGVGKLNDKDFGSSTTNYNINDNKVVTTVEKSPPQPKALPNNTQFMNSRTYRYAQQIAKGLQMA